MLGSIIGTLYENDQTLAFSALNGVRPRIEILPPESPPESYRRLKSRALKYRLVLNMAVGSR